MVKNEVPMSPLARSPSTVLLLRLQNSFSAGRLTVGATLATLACASYTTSRIANGAAARVPV